MKKVCSVYVCYIRNVSPLLELDQEEGGEEEEGDPSQAGDDAVID